MDEASIYDVAPTLLYLGGHPVPDDMDGRVLTELIENEFLAEKKIETLPAIENCDIGDSGFSPEEDAEVIDRLKGLGYLG
jgi:hypothetical protein